jgi:hypothetical protein
MDDRGVYRYNLWDRFPRAPPHPVITPQPLAPLQPVQPIKQYH